MTLAGRGASVEDRWSRIISGDAAGLTAGLARAGLALASGPYWLGLKGNLALYEWGLKAHTQPVLPVLSVGNLSLGGTGKTTAVRLLARHLSAAGLNPGIVLRGHRRKRGPGSLVASDGRGGILPADQTGDEAAEYARLLPDVPVAVGKRREISLQTLAALGARVGLLDDGYQYFRMARDWEIALVNARMDLRQARLFPRGVLREPWSHLRRASQVWVTHADQVAPGALERICDLCARFAPRAKLLTARHAPAGLHALPDGHQEPLADLAGQRVVAVCGLGDPEAFEQTLRDLGAEVVPLRFADHHRYEPEDWTRAASLAREHDAAWLVTTEKDAVKTNEAPPWPTIVLRSELDILTGGEHLQALLAEVGERVDGS